MDDQAKAKYELEFALDTTRRLTDSVSMTAQRMRKPLDQFRA
jgi:hypothetical protein